MQLGNAPAATDPIHHAGANEIGPRTTEPARRADDADGLGQVLPVPAADARAVGEIQPIGLGAQIDRGNLLYFDF